MTVRAMIGGTVAPPSTTSSNHSPRLSFALFLLLLCCCCGLTSSALAFSPPATASHSSSSSSTDRRAVQRTRDDIAATGTPQGDEILTQDHGSDNSMASQSPLPPLALAPPIVYTIAGSDSGGGAGIQADLHAIHSLGCHGCSAVTCLTAQSSQGVMGVHAPPIDFLGKQLNCLLDDLKPGAVKVGMLGTAEVAETVGKFLKRIKTDSSGGEEEKEKPYVVVDPVMISTSGHRLIDSTATSAMFTSVFPYADVLTPNKYEAEALLGRELRTPADIEEGAREILKMGVKSVLIKGGHSLIEGKEGEEKAMEGSGSNGDDVNATVGYAQDYFLSSEERKDEGEESLCDDGRGVWLRSDRYDSDNTHGTGCTLSSALAASLALGRRARTTTPTSTNDPTLDVNGATRAISPIDACCLAKAYVTAGIGKGVQLGKGPGPVAHTSFPSSHRHFPVVALNPTARSSDVPPFLPMRRLRPAGGEGAVKGSTTASTAPRLGAILPIVDTPEWIERLCAVPGITDLQLRIKGDAASDPTAVLERVRKAQAFCAASNVRLWINDHWKAAIECNCFGVHLGQEDLTKCADRGGLDEIKAAGLALGVSTHSYGELAVALGVKPSYVSLGPVFGTTSKNVAFGPQGLEGVRKWRELIDPDVPLVAIGGIVDAASARRVKEAGADCVAVIGAVTKVEDVDAAVAALNGAMME